MPILKRTGVSLGSIVTSKILDITSAETVYRMESGNVGFEATNYGSYTVFYGQSGVLVNSGGAIYWTGAKEWTGITGDWTIYFALDTGGVSSQLVINEYRGM